MVDRRGADARRRLARRPPRPRTTRSSSLDVGAGFVAPGWAVGDLPDGAVALHRRSDHGVPGSAVLGSRDGLAALLDDPRVRDWVRGAGNRHLSVPRGLIDVALDRLDLGDRGGEWDWMWTRATPPPVPGEDAVLDLEPDRPRRGRGLPHRAQPQRRTASRSPAPASAGSRCATTGTARSSPSAAVSPARRAPRRSPGSPSRATGGARGGVPRSPPASPATPWHRPGPAPSGCSPTTTSRAALYHRLGFVTGMEWTSRWFA